MKKFLTILGGVFASILVIGVIGAVIFVPRTLKLHREAVAYIKDAVPRIVEHWDSHELVTRATPELLETTEAQKNLEKYFTVFKKLGSLKHLNEPGGTVFRGAYSKIGSVTVGNYVAQAEFENGSGTIAIQLRRTNDAWRINGFRINSDALLPTNP